MQLASHGARAAARKAPPTARSIHIPSAIRPQAHNLGQRLLTQTRLALTRFVTHLTTPGTGTVSVARSFHAANPSIHQRLSFAARTTLARPLQPRFLPRGPALPRTITQVGLGTARNFSSGRPIFQQLADNIPIAGRAFYEADWELNMHKERENMRRPAKKAATPKQASKQMLKATVKADSIKTTVSTKADELEHYFAAPNVPAVTTSLLIPLAPPPAPARAPLPEFPPARLPLPALLELHDAHSTHALRVSSLFHRLDTADVWTRGAACAAYASTAGGACTVLKVEFTGWTAAAVRGVIGESGTGWCVLEEAPTAATPEYDDDDDALSDTSSVLSSLGFDMGREDAAQTDPARALVLPTLDFSSSFRAAVDSPSVHSDSASSWDIPPFATVDPPSENGWFESRIENPWLGSDSDSDLGSDGWLDSASCAASDDGWLDATPSVLGFSAGFAERVAEPLESPFA
ncbi:hypothetical protein B0H15DRAFT_819832 [Mycena belliarum]|uniref:Uncharacterized protein n=1 Tax=Mycena belliarum TaxID=1033014 RepID=A0AAD6UJT6_9AGAR|nr:hypothetical protein B0H15DRAFT_819832 [Mycena belliae]